MPHIDGSPDTEAGRENVGKLGVYQGHVGSLCHHAQRVGTYGREGRIYLGWRSNGEGGRRGDASVLAQNHHTSQ